jgi:hypothetical protein
MARVSIIIATSRCIAPRNVIIGNCIEVFISWSHTTCRLAESTIKSSIADFFTFASCSCTQAFSGLEILASDNKILLGTGIRYDGRICQWGNEEKDTKDAGSHIDEIGVKVCGMHRIL